MFKPSNFYFLKMIHNEIRSMMDIYPIFLMDNKDFISWLSQHQFIHNINAIYKCHICQNPMTIQYSDSFLDGAAWVCHGIKKHMLNLREDTIFKHSNINLKISILVFSTWALDFTPSQAKLVFPILPSVDTISVLFQKYRQLSEKAYYDDILQSPLGGANRIVQIDETLVSKAKNSKGRALKQKPMWFFGGVDSLTGRTFIEYVSNRSHNTLLPMIQKFITKSSIIHSDEWRAYSQLNNIGYFHRTVNHIIILSTL